MSAQAGWYPDPSGNADKLRFWDGNQWTSDFMDATAASQTAQQVARQVPQASVPASAQAQVQPPVQTIQSAQQPKQTYQQANYGAPVTAATTTYALSSTDSTLRLIAFVFDVLTIVTCAGVGIASFGIGLIPLAWVIPMTVMTWHVYQGKRANTIALGVCTLLFINLVSGILLLCSSKER